MAYSKRQYQDITDAQFDQYRDNQYGEYLDRLDEEQISNRMVGSKRDERMDKNQ